MREILIPAAAGAILLSPHAAEQSAAAETVHHIESVTLQDTAPELLTQPEAELPQVVQTEDPDQYNLAISEFLDPNGLYLWFEVGGAAVLASLVGGAVTSRKLKKKIREDYAEIVRNGQSAHFELLQALSPAEAQTAGLKADDVPDLRNLTTMYTATVGQLDNALKGAAAEFAAERDKLFPRRSKLHEKLQTSTVITTTENTPDIVQELQRGVEKVQNDRDERDTYISRARNTISLLQANLSALRQKGWDLSAYDARISTFEEQIANAQKKREENYVDAPTKLAKTAARDALLLQAEAANLEERRAAADAVYNEQMVPAATVQATVTDLRERFTRLQDTYDRACLVGFERFSTKLEQAMSTLTEAHETGATITGDQGKSVEAVAKSEKLSNDFTRAFEQIQTLETELLNRDEELAVLAIRLPRKVSGISSQFDEALRMADSGDLSATLREQIRALTDDVASLSHGMRISEDHKPNYLRLSKDSAKLGKMVAETYATAARQKEEMDNMRTAIPQIAAGHNRLVAAVKDFADRAGTRLSDRTRSHIAQLERCDLELETSRFALASQQHTLTSSARDVLNLIREVEWEANENDDPVLQAAKTLTAAIFES